jgi:hypothetical protein
MDILNFISWIASKRRVVTSVPDDALVPVGIRTETRDDKYTTVGIKKSDLISPTLPYKVYTALLTQISGAPVATVLENTIGNIVWTRSNAGQYVGTLSGAFVSGKTALFIQKSVGLAKIQLVPKDLWIEYTDANTITIITTDDTNLIDNVLNNTTIEIRVYN